MLLTSAAKVLSGQWANIVVLFLEGVLLANVLGPAGLGKWAIVQAVFFTIGSLLSFRTSEALTRYLIKARKKSQIKLQGKLLTAALTTDILVFFLITVIGVMVSVVFTKLISVDEKIPELVFVIFGLSFLPKFAANTWVSIARIENQFWRLSFLQFITSFARVLILFFLALYGVLNLYFLSIVHTTVAFLVGAYQLRSVISWIKMCSIPPIIYSTHILKSHELKDYRSLLFVGFITSSLSSVIKNLDILILGAWRQPEEVGWYKLAKSLVGSLQSASSALNQVVFLNLSELAEQSTLHNAMLYINKNLKYMWLIFLGLYVVGGMIFWLYTPYIYGSAFEQTTQLLPILLFGSFISAIFFWTNSMLVAFEMFRGLLLLSIASSIYAIVLFFTLTPQYGYFGTAAALSSTWALGHIAAYIYIKSRGA